MVSAVSLSSEKCPSTHHLTWKAFRNGNVEAFEMLYYYYFHELFNNNRNICADKEMIRDCIHDLFVEIWEKRTRLSVPYSVKAYLQISVRRRLIRSLRERRLRQERLEIPEMIALSSEDSLIGEQTILFRSRLVVRALSCLTGRQQKALFLKFYAGMSYPEIAESMSITKRSVYNIVAKAISILQCRFNRSDFMK
ncbi:MAG: sigma-70 family RNA polymerase sigma factor [Chitinophagaceae bacterium]|nr:sigma-70 family RNA polymerase sigma factor [Chitinophagaceae bacterium]